MTVVTLLRPFHPMRPPRLRPYQEHAARAVMRSVLRRDGRTITVQIARQGGKNELSAQLEMFLLAMLGDRGDIIKCAPTFHPQLLISIRRLLHRLQQAGVPGASAGRGEVRVGGARILFLSAAAGASVVGHTAGLLLEVDEAQDVDPEIYDRLREVWRVAAVAVEHAAFHQQFARARMAHGDARWF
jgi:hypothetical protein